ncbi:MAG: ribonuclease HII [Candidatus Cloacimonetes bacterium]|nr:ribonuclease HII [Candidatus Cloacimonadota bacterium]
MLYAAEHELHREHGLLAGVDEAGRGPLAGPVVVAAVILDHDKPIAGLNDSKKLTAARREALYDAILASALDWEIVEMSAGEVDEMNVLRATLEGMRRAVLGLHPAPALVLVDGNQLPDLPFPARAEVKGDGRFASIAAASILAKVWRDRLMVAMHSRYPLYGFDRHKGYGTQAHRDAIAAHGICPQHRKTFGPCVEMRVRL